jgi:hypothetical protein
MIKELGSPNSSIPKTSSFLSAKNEFDDKYRDAKFLPKSFVPVNRQIIENIKIRNENGEPVEEYYKWHIFPRKRNQQRGDLT